MPNVAESFLTGLHSGRAEVHQAREEAEREIRQKILKASLDREKLQDLMQKYQFQFKVKQEQAAATSGQPRSAYGPQDIQSENLSSRGLGLAASPDVQAPQPEMQLTPVMTPASPELGIESFPIQRQTAEQQQRKALQAEMLQGVTVPEGAQRYVGGRLVAENQKTGPSTEPLERQLLNAMRSGNPREATLIREAIKLARTADDDPVLTQLRSMQLELLRQRGSNLTPLQFNMANKLSDDFARDSRDFLSRAQGYGTVLASAKDPSPAGDLSLIFSYMKMLDPGSVVREGEFATAQNSAAVPDRIRNVYNRVMSGERLNPTQRSDFVQQAGAVFGSAKQRQDGLVKTFTARASLAKVPLELVIIDYAAGVPTPGSVRMRAPDGTTALVPSDQVDAAKAKGAVSVP